ncbi:hypothetical protein TanjilG_19162 [Lupinus angustifolius]|uniref:Transmembrane protein n=1 Tax=Lupinus angustifolius TaxID=3871 RepID=A0A4P1RS12_LUPAN|nr:hypothetical protein TanjilG_19162 [Lupinus angustifolius]
MGMMVVISLPLIILSLMIGLGCYLFGRARGRKDVQTNPQVYGMPTPPPGAGAASTSPPPHYFKPDNATANV